ncbi:MAG: hypothetical protein V9H26_11725 [Verrucomicrobiota bacterium]
MNSNSIKSHPGRPVGLAWVTALTGLLALAAPLQAQSYYDFDGGTDTGWRKSTVHPSTVTYPTDALGGKAYRLQGTPMNSGSDTNSRVFSYFTNRVYTNFYASVDVVSWNTNQDCEQVIGLIARANGNNALPPGSGLFDNNLPFDPDTPNGLTFNARSHNYRAYTGPTNNAPLGSADQMSAWSIVNFFGTTFLGNPVSVTQARFRWVPGRAYRLVLSSTNAFGAAPAFFTASIYDVNDLTKPLLTMTGDDTYNGNFDYIPQYGYVGVMAYKLANGDYDPTVDVTFDNFYVGETAPVTAVVAPAIPHGKLGAPQVINRIPASFKNFHPAASGIAFTATTLTTTNAINTAATKLFLNGADVSAALVISGPATNASVSYSGLTSNVVYSARIVLSDALGRSTTNEWTFDTFSDAYLASSAVKVIEAEDYDFNNGQFINNPPASGYAGYDPLNDTGTQINPVVGYVDQAGSNAKDGGVDFFDYDTGPHSLDNQYRHSDGVGTQQGNFAFYAYGDSTATLLPYGVPQSYDTQRSKYSSLNPTLQEYIVERTEGGEWLNYTRVFDGSKTYNAYLRAAGGLAQPVRLDQIGAGPVTNLLGQFNVPSTFFINNYRYVPLVTTNGDLATVNLSGTNTVRLTFDSPQNDVTKFGLSLNYLVLVPAAPPAPKLYSSATVNGAYAEETGAVVNTTSKTITVPLSGATRFYRIAFTSQLTISGLTISGSNVVLTYQ